MCAALTNFDYRTCKKTFWSVLLSTSHLTEFSSSCTSAMSASILLRSLCERVCVCACHPLRPWHVSQGLQGNLHLQTCVLTSVQKCAGMLIDMCIVMCTSTSTDMCRDMCTFAIRPRDRCYQRQQRRPRAAGMQRRDGSAITIAHIYIGISIDVCRHV